MLKMMRIVLASILLLIRKPSCDRLVLPLWQRMILDAKISGRPYRSVLRWCFTKAGPFEVAVSLEGKRQRLRVDGKREGERQ